MKVKELIGVLHNSRYFPMGIRNRILLFFIFIVFVPVFFISLVIYSESARATTRRIDEDLQRNANLMENNIIQKFEAINDISNYIYLNPELVKIISSDHPKDKIDVINEMATLDRILNSYNVSNITRMNLVPTLYMLNRPEYYQYNFSDKIFDLSMIERSQWYLNLPTKAEYSVVGLNTINIDSSSVNTIRIAKRLFGLKNANVSYAALLTIDVGIDDFIEILDQFKPSLNSSIFIIDSDMSVVLSHDNSMLGRNLKGEDYLGQIVADQRRGYGTFIEKIDNSDMLILYKKIKSLNWFIVSLSPVNELFKELYNFKKMLLLVISICIAVTFVMAFLLSDNISNPIRKLVKSMSRVQDGNFDINIEYKRNDEFYYLINTYKKMMHEIKELINKLYISEVNKKEAELKIKEAELKALQAQINPHFLYNTLDSINWLAIEYEADQISTMVTSLSDFFRYSLNKGNNIISLREEKKQVESYLTIQKIRFKDKLDYSISFPNNILHYLTVKLIMQPIVENSITHGIEKKKGKGFIGITAQKCVDIIEIRISDNGIGTDIDELNKTLLDSSISLKHFAVKNINERIKQAFGEDYGLKFYNNESSGILVIIRIPAVGSVEGLNV